MKSKTILFATFTGACAIAMAADIPLEKPLAFRKRLVTVHAPDVRDKTLKPANNEFAFRDGVALAGADDPLVRRGLEDFADYLSTSMRVKAAKSGAHGGAGNVEVALDGALAEREYTVAVGTGGVKINAKDGRAAMQALFHLEDLMNLRRAPFLPFGNERRRMRFSPRMTHSGYARDIFPDGHLAQIAHAGFDAILFNISAPNLILKAYGSTNVNALIDAAAAWGLDSYMYSNVKATRHPDDPESPAEMAATYGAIAKLHNKAKGLLIVPESCHFMSRDPRMKRLRDSAFFPCSDWPLYLRRVEETLRAGNPGIDLVFWTYNFYSRPEKDRFAFIDAITPTTTLNVTFAIGDEREHPTRLGKAFPVNDYSIATSGPSHLFKAEAARGHARGLKVYTTSNTGGRTWDVGCAPFEPVPQRWKARFNALVAAQRDYGLAGLIESHQYGFAPNFVAELAKEAFTEGGLDFDTHLHRIAARDFGEANADEVVATWADLSDAIRDNVVTSQNQYGPLRLGPAYPFNALGPLLKKGDWPGFTSWMCNPNYGYYIPWGKPFGTVEQPREELDAAAHKVEIELFGSAGRRFVEGGEKLRKFADELSGERRLHARREAGVVEYIGRCFITTANVKAGAIEERVATDESRSAQERETARKHIGEIARAEYANTRASVDLLRENSHLGCLNIGTMLSTASEYIGGLERVEWKLRHMEKLYGIKP